MPGTVVQTASLCTHPSSKPAWEPPPEDDRRCGGRRFFCCQDGGKSIRSATDFPFGVVGPIVRPSTLEPRLRDRDSGRITRDWAEHFRNRHTDTGGLGMRFSTGVSRREEMLLLAAALLINAAYFENQD